MVLFCLSSCCVDIRRIEVTPSRVKMQNPWDTPRVHFLLETLLVLRSGAINEMVAAAPPPPPDFGTAVALGRALVVGYFFPLQLAAVLLFIALIGAIVLSKRRW